MNHKEVINERGKVIEKFVYVDLMVCTIISMHYLKKVDNDFIINVLNNEMCSFGFKKSILKQILVGDVNVTNLEKLNNIRNLFGHAIINQGNGYDIKDEKAVILFNDPKHQGQFLDPSEKSKEFNDLFGSVMKWLQDEGIKKGINFPST